MARDTRRLRCAIYTRKSTEKGLENAFNSLSVDYTHDKADSRTNVKTTGASY